jgi:hypothetical protein
MRQFVLTLLFALLIISLNRDETWALPDIADGFLSEADLEEIIDRGLPGPEIIVEVPACPCDSTLPPLRPISEADDCDCASEQQIEWICGTMALRAETEIREAREAGLHPWAIAQLVEQNCRWLGTC